MLAFKFLAEGRIAPFSGVRWPEPGRWIEARPGLGVHACTVEDLPYWFDEELWAVELHGPVDRARRQLVAPRGRLILPVSGWSAAKADFTAACVERTRRRVIDALGGAGASRTADRLAAEREDGALKDVAADLSATGVELAGYVFDVVRRRPHPGLCAYIAATAAAAIAGIRGHDEERAAQSAWLCEALQLRSS